MAETPVTPADVADLVATHATELSILARNAGLEPLAYLLDMAQLEAAGVLRDAAEKQAA